MLVYSCCLTFVWVRSRLDLSNNALTWKPAESLFNSAVVQFLSMCGNRFVQATYIDKMVNTTIPLTCPAQQSAYGSGAYGQGDSSSPMSNVVQVIVGGGTGFGIAAVVALVLLKVRRASQATAKEAAAHRSKTVRFTPVLPSENSFKGEPASAAETPGASGNSGSVTVTVNPVDSPTPLLFKRPS